MQTIGNILWLVLAGFWLAIGYVIAGLLAFVLIVTIPFGIASFRLASFVVWPFGRTTTWRRDAGIWSVIGNVVWIIFFGWELALLHLLAGALLMLTIIGIPFGVACWKMIPLSLVPLGREIVPISSVASDPYGVPACTSRTDVSQGDRPARRLPDGAAGREGSRQPRHISPHSLRHAAITAGTVDQSRRRISFLLTNSSMP